MGTRRVGVVGASGRAAAASLVRAGVTPWVVDLFADRDTQRVAECIRCPFDQYPAALPSLCEGFARSPVLYTGGLENHPEVVAQIAADHELWGNDPGVLQKVRDPFFLQDAGILMPHTRQSLPSTGRWLRKARSAGGQGIRWAHENDTLQPGEYFQEHLDGPAFSAQYRTSKGKTALLGVTLQLVGTPWLHAEPFHYTGNIGPLLPSPREEEGDRRQNALAHANLCQEELEELGRTLPTLTGLHGVWGIDFILHDGRPHLLEVNPRYTAAMEVLELVHGFSVFNHSSSVSTGCTCVGKAIYFAPHRIRFPVVGPWDADLALPFDPWRVPGFADLPVAGEVIERGWPVLTFYSSSDAASEVQNRLQLRAAELDRLFEEATP